MLLEYREFKHIALRQCTYEQLKKIGKKGDSFDFIVSQLLKVSQKQRQRKIESIKKERNLPQANPSRVGRSEEDQPATISDTKSRLKRMEI